MCERDLHGFRGVGPHGDRLSGLVGFVELLDVGDVVEDERPVDVKLTFDGDLGNAAASRAEPALSHSVIDPPGSISSTVAFGASSLSSAGVPLRTGKVP